MNRIYDHVKVSFANARRRLGGFNPAPLWRSVVMALVLALVVGSAGQPSPARAAPAGDATLWIGLFAEKIGGERTICTGDKVLIRVRVVQRIEIIGSEENYSLAPSIGVEVGASVDGNGVGRISPAKNTTRLDSEPMGATYFTFSAEKPGATTVVFQAKLNTRVVLGFVLSSITIPPTRVPLTVIDCSYKVTAISRWSGFGLNYVAMIDQAGLTADAPGHYTGTATVNWVITQMDSTAGCISHATTFTSQADLTGDTDEDGQQLVVDLAYQLAEVKATWYHYFSDCTATNSHELVSYTPDPLTLSVPASGGVSSQSQALVDMLPSAQNMAGSADVVVTPVTKR